MRSPSLAMRSDSACWRDASADCRSLSFCWRRVSASERDDSLRTLSDSFCLRIFSALTRSASDAVRACSLARRTDSFSTLDASLALRSCSLAMRSSSWAIRSDSAACRAFSAASRASSAVKTLSYRPVSGARIATAVSMSRESSPSSVTLKEVSADALLSTMAICSYSLLRQSTPPILPFTSKAYLPTYSWSPSTFARMTLSSATSIVYARDMRRYGEQILTMMSVHAGRGMGMRSPL